MSNYHRFLEDDYYFWPLQATKTIKHQIVTAESVTAKVEIIITTVSGETYQVKCLPHYIWFGALLDPRGALEASRKPKSAPPVENAGTLDWFYESGGATVGPVHEKEMVQLIKNSSTVFRDTRVWNKSLPEWKRAEETILSIFFIDSHDSRPAKARTDSGLLGRLWPHIQVLGRKYF